MSCPPSDERQDINKKSITSDEELKSCKLRLNSSVQRLPLCTSSISSHRTELVLNLPSKSLENTPLHRSELKVDQPVKEQSSPQRQPVNKVSHSSDLSSVNQPLSPQQLTQVTINDNYRQIENLYESLNYSPSLNQQPVAYESQPTKTSHAALHLQPVIPQDNIYQPISTQLTYHHSHQQNSHPFRPRGGSIRFSSTFPARNQTNNNSLGTIIHNSAGSLTIPNSSQVTYCIPFNSSPGSARFSVSFTGNSSHLPGSSTGSSSSFTFIQSSPSSTSSAPQVSQVRNLPSTSRTQLFVDSHKITSPQSGQLFTQQPQPQQQQQQHQQPQQLSFVGSKVTSVVIHPFQLFDSSTMNRQISAPSSSRHPSEPNLIKLPGRSASVSPNASPIPPPRPAVPKPSSRRPTTSSTSSSIANDGYLTGLLHEQQESLNRLIEEVGKKKLQVEATRNEVSHLEYDVSNSMKCRNGLKVNASQAQEIRNQWERKRLLSIECQYWTLAVDSFGDHYLGDVNGEKPPPKLSPSSNPPKIPERPRRSPGIQTKAPTPFSELDIRVPIQKIRTTSTSNLVRSAEPSRWSCSSCKFLNLTSQANCSNCSKSRH